MSIRIEGVKSMELEFMLGETTPPLPSAPEPFNIVIDSEDIASNVTNQQSFNDFCVEKMGALLYRNNIMRHSVFSMRSGRNSTDKYVSLSWREDIESHIPLYSIGPMKFPNSFSIGAATIRPTDSSYRKSEITIENLRWGKEMYLKIIMHDPRSANGAAGKYVEFTPAYTPENKIDITATEIEYANTYGLTKYVLGDRKTFPNFGQVLFGRDITPEDLDDPVWVINHYSCPTSIKNNLETMTTDFADPSALASNFYGWYFRDIRVIF